jgi:serine/threonine-protein kinase HipA
MFSKTLGVFYHGRRVGWLTDVGNNCHAFQYAQEWLETGFAIDPFHLPLRKEKFIASPPYDILQVFFCAQSGRVHQYFIFTLLLVHNIYQRISFLDELAILGRFGVGALEYSLEETFGRFPDDDLIRKIAQELNTAVNKTQDELEDILSLWTFVDKKPNFIPQLGMLFSLFFIKINGEDWLLKFKEQNDTVEWRNNLLARRAGLNLPEIKLLNNQHFMSKRFDRKSDGGKIHMCNIGRLMPKPRGRQADYIDLLKLAMELTRSVTETAKLFRRMCFCNFVETDESVNNFSFLYDAGCWSVAPDYDLDKLPPHRPRRLLTVNGKISPAPDDILTAAKAVGLPLAMAKDIMLEVEAVFRQGV